MMSPITIVVPMASSDPAPAPAPAEDPALFTAALNVALQSGIVPVPQATTAAETPRATEGEGGVPQDGEGALTTEADSQPAQPKGHASGAGAEVATGTATPATVRSAVAGSSTAPEAVAPGSAEVALPVPQASLSGAEPVVSVEGEPLSKTEGAASRLSPAGTSREVVEKGRELPATRRMSERAPGTGPRRSSRVVAAGAAPAQLPGESGAVVEVPLPSPFGPTMSPQRAAPPGLDGMATPAAGKQNGAASEAHPHGSRAASSDEPSTEQAMQTCGATGCDLASTAPPANVVGPAKPSAASLDAGGSSGAGQEGRSAAEETGSPTPVPAEAAPASRGAAPVQTVQTVTDAGFVRALAEIMGDAEISELRVTAGRGGQKSGKLVAGGEKPADEATEHVVPRTARVATNPGATVRPVATLGRFLHPEGSSNLAATLRAPLPVDAGPGAAPPGAVEAAGSGALPSGSVPATATALTAGEVVPNPGAPAPAIEKPSVPTDVPAITGDTDHPARAAVTASVTEDVVRAERAPAPRVLPEPVPFMAPARGRSSAGAHDLPALRQDLPVTNMRTTRDAPQPAERARDRADSASDAGNGVVPSSGSPREAATRGEARARDAQPGEARNLRDDGAESGRPAGIADRVSLKVSDAEGRETRIRVSVIGDQVRAVLQPSDGESARQLERRMDDLQQALIRQGFTDPKVTVQVAATRGETGTPWAAATGGPGEPAPSRGTDQPTGDQRQGSGRREAGRDGEGERHPQQRNRERDPQGRRR